MGRVIRVAHPCRRVSWATFSVKTAENSESMKRESLLSPKPRRDSPGRGCRVMSDNGYNMRFLVQLPEFQRMTFRGWEFSGDLSGRCSSFKVNAGSGYTGHNEEKRSMCIKCTEHCEGATQYSTEESLVTTEPQRFTVRATCCARSASKVDGQSTHSPKSAVWRDAVRQGERHPVNPTKSAIACARPCYAGMRCCRGYAPMVASGARISHRMTLDIRRAKGIAQRNRTPSASHRRLAGGFECPSCNPARDTLRTSDKEQYHHECAK